MKYLLALALLGSLVLTQGQKRTFEVDYTHDTFLKDGKSFSYVSGELDYFRVPREYWKDRIHKIKLLGFNAISTFVEWSLHEPSPGKFHFEGDADLVYFIGLVEAEGLNVILRTGPFIESNRDFGGLPPWLLLENGDMEFRTSDPSYTFLVTQWYNELFKHIQPLLYGNGGPIIMVGVENHYGMFPYHEAEHLQWLADLTHSYVQGNAVLFTTDDYSGIPFPTALGALPTVIFGPTIENMTSMVHLIREKQPHGPLVNSEFSTSWFTYWGDNVTLEDSSTLLPTMKNMLENKFSFNCYMIAGGTNFGFTTGTDLWNNSIAATSFFNDAPINEAGDLTDKYMAIWALMKQYGWPVGSEDEINALKAAPKGNYGSVYLNPVVPLLNSGLGTSVRTPWPLAMEYFHQSGGFISYSHTIETKLEKTTSLTAFSRDRTIVLVNGNQVGVIGEDETINIPPQFEPTSTITLLVENLGRKDFQILYNISKGIVSNVTLDGVPLYDWQTTSYSFTPEDIEKIELTSQLSGDVNVQLPAFYSGSLIVPYPADTFLDMTGWGKGVAFVNGHNLGRYWDIGPQYTLFVPGVWLNRYPKENNVTIMELHHTNSEKTVEFIPAPKFDYRLPSTYSDL